MVFLTFILSQSRFVYLAYVFRFGWDEKGQDLKNTSFRWLYWIDCLLD
jgi:hypothetical protein